MTSLCDLASVVSVRDSTVLSQREIYHLWKSFTPDSSNETKRGILICFLGPYGNSNVLKRKRACVFFPYFGAVITSQSNYMHIKSMLLGWLQLEPIKLKIIQRKGVSLWRCNIPKICLLILLLEFKMCPRAYPSPSPSWKWINATFIIVT